MGYSNVELSSVVGIRIRFEIIKLPGKVDLAIYSTTYSMYNTMTRDEEYLYRHCVPLSCRSFKDA